MECEEIRVDLSKVSAEHSAERQHSAQLLFKLNHTLPFSDEYNSLLHELWARIWEREVTETDAGMALNQEFYAPFCFPTKRLNTNSAVVVMSTHKTAMAIPRDTLPCSNSRLI